MKGFKSITTTQTNYYGGDSTLYRSVYTVNSVGDIVRSEEYHGHTLTSWTTYQYYDNGLLKYEEHHGQFFSYDENTRKDTARISDDNYYGTIFEYNGDLLVKETHINCFDGSKSYPYVILYEYDNAKRLIKETSFDTYLGPTFEFRPNSSQIDTVYNKHNKTRQTTTHLYKTNTVVSTEYGNKNEVMRRTITTLSPTKMPVKILTTDDKNNEMQSVTKTYGANGLLVQETIEIFNIDKITYDIAAGDKYQLFYNDRSLPTLALTSEDGHVIFKEEILYE